MKKVMMDGGGKGRVADVQFEDEGGEVVGVGPVTVRFLERFSGHALGRTVYRESSPFRKLIWFVIFLIATGYMTYQIVDTIKIYMSGPKTTTIEVETERTLSFPAVTICPYSPLWKGLANDPSQSDVQKILELNKRLEEAVRHLLQSQGSCAQTTTTDLPSPVGSDVGCNVSDGGKRNCINPFQYIYPAFDAPIPRSQNTTVPTTADPTTNPDATEAPTDETTYQDATPGSTKSLDPTKEPGRIDMNHSAPQNSSDEEDYYYPGDLQDEFDDLGIDINPSPNASIRINNVTIRADDFVDLLLLTSSYTLSDFRKYLNLADVASNLSNFIHHCSFNDVPCSRDDYITTTNSDYGECLTFNSKGDKQVLRSGSSQGLQLRLVWDASNNVILLSPAKGFRLTLHHPRAEPDPVGEGFDVNMKMNSFVGIRKMELERLHPDEGGDCAYDSYFTRQFDTKIFRIKKDAKYSKQLCLDLCKIKVIREHDETKCYFKSPLLQSSVNRSFEEEKMDDPARFVFPREEKFYWSLSSAQTVTENAMLLDLVAWMRSERKRGVKGAESNETYCHQSIEDKNLAIVNIYYETMTMEKIVENPMFTWTSFIGTLGGLLGLYTGLSFISILEVLECGLDIVLYGWRKPRHDKMGPKRLVVLTWRDTLQQEGGSTKKSPGVAWGDSPVYNPQSLNDTRRAGFDLVFSDTPNF
ncbi:unnamed protein product [Darwinula stevensoni]|uniref:Uncharacterized protein n=1 Tax=Darwinula stevensoni TaxID=69355 RepID=A0A7R9FQE8_9CRUS|nr:unnamed protein product [Darwinula stevensoni]CAG0899356.1 unnamed protein product [Darwinula stevensoni]